MAKLEKGKIVLEDLTKHTKPSGLQTDSTAISKPTSATISLPKSMIPSSSSGTTPISGLKAPSNCEWSKFQPCNPRHHLHILPAPHRLHIPHCSTPLSFPPYPSVNHLSRSLPLHLTCSLPLYRDSLQDISFHETFGSDSVRTHWLHAREMEQLSHIQNMGQEILQLR